MSHEISLLETEITSLQQQVQTYHIRTSADYHAAGGLLQDIKRRRQRVDEVFGPIIDAAHKAHKEAVAKRKQVEAPLIAAEGTVKAEIAAFLQAEEVKRRDEERKLQAVAKHAAETMQLETAAMLEADGRQAEAAAVLDAAPMVPVIAPPAAPKVDGVSTRSVWKYSITNPALVPREYLMVDTAKIGSVVRAMKQLTNIPGISVYEEKGVVVR